MGNKKIILIVDDDKTVLFFLDKALKTIGYETHISLSGTDALSIARKQRPDLVLLDVQMPEMDGITTMEELHKLHPGLPVIFQTGQEDVETLEKAFRKGAVDFIIKPAKILELDTRIRKVIISSCFDQSGFSCNVPEITIWEQNQALLDTQLEIICRLTKVAEYKDIDTANHIVRMAYYSVLLAREIGIEQRICWLILNASPMHDIGKVGIPDSILLKPDKLTDDEWKVMVRHPFIGSKILKCSKSEIIRMGEIIAMSHHEKWDGSGYPRKLKGEDIPLVGRITAIADVFDALTSMRPYKKAWSAEEAFNLIEKDRGKHFDPVLVEAFLNIKEKILSVKEKFKG
ncbi:MAG: response regulator [Desulfamplus sp.]|nr:response regulator [Desulfamplus sp.]